MPFPAATWSLGLQYMSGANGGLLKDEGKGLQLLFVAWDAGYPEAIEFLPQLVNTPPVKLPEIAESAKMVFGPSDAQLFTAAQLKDRASRLWSKMKNGTANVSDFPSYLIAEVNAKRSEAIPCASLPALL